MWLTVELKMYVSYYPGLTRWMYSIPVLIFIPELKPSTTCLKRHHVIHMATETKQPITCEMGMNFNLVCNDLDHCN